MADNVVEILVKSRNDTKAGFDSAKADAELAGDEAGQGFMAKFGSWLVGGQTSSGGGGIGGILSTAFSSGPAGIAALATVIGASLVEIVGLVNGLTAAAAGIGALGLVALPTLDKIKNAYTAISAAQTTLAGAKAKEALAPSKANETAVKNAQIALELAQRSAGPVAGAVSGVQKLAGAFGKMATSFQPQVLQIFNQAIGIAAQLLPTVATFAQAAAPAVEEVMKQLSKGINSQGFKDFVSQFSKISGPAIEAIGAGFGKVAAAVGKLLTVMSAHDVVHALNIAFDAIAITIRVLTVLVGDMMLTWDKASSHIAAFAKAAARDLANWAQVADNMVHNVETWFVNLPGNILKALSALGGILFRAGEDAIRGFMNGLKSVPIIGTVASIASGIVGTFKHILGIGSPSRVLMEIGKNTAEGFHLGLTQSQGGLGGTITSSGGGAAGGWVEARFAGSQGPVMDALMQQQKLWIRRHGGGSSASVQVALGQ